MKWTEIKVRTTYEAAEAVGEILYRNGANGLVVEDISPSLVSSSSDWDYVELPETEFPSEEVQLVAYLPTTSRLPQVVENIRESVENLKEFGLNVGQATIELAEVEEEDWANNWKQYYKPVFIGQRLLVRPLWEKVDTADERVVIDIDPGMAFGTGTHASTSMSLQLLEQYLQPGYEVFDVGTGSGILAIAAAKLGANSVLALDKDEMATRVAVRNIALNGLSDRITVKTNDLLVGVTKHCDLLVANITAGILVRLIPMARDAIRGSGPIILSGIITQRELEVQRTLVENSFVVVDRLQQDEWVALVARQGTVDG